MKKMLMPEISLFPKRLATGSPKRIHMTFLTTCPAYAILIA